MPRSRIVLLTRTEEPLLVPERRAGGNETVSADHISGGVVRGAVASLAAMHGVDAQFVRRYVDGDLLFDPLLPAVVSGTSVLTGIPAPRSVQTCKAAPGLAADGGHGKVEQLVSSRGQISCPACGGPLDGFGGYVASDLHCGVPAGDRDVSMHIEVDDLTRRAADGRLFSEVAIAPGALYFGAVRGNDEDVRAVARLLEGTSSAEDGWGRTSLAFGKRSRKGHGRTSVWWKMDEDDGFPDGTIERRPLVACGERTVTMVTDTILVDEYQRATDDLESALRLALDDVTVTVEDAFMGWRQVDGWSGATNLPRHPDVAITAGSNALIRTTATVEKIRAVERCGIGFRRGEGYGRIIFDLPLYEAGA